mgnify:CR=1 FL=1
MFGGVLKNISDFTGMYTEGLGGCHAIVIIIFNNDVYEQIMFAHNPISSNIISIIDQYKNFIN